jgi:hypothetical protein
MHPVTPSVAESTHVEHALLPPLVEAAAAESLQMAFAAPELAIADVRPCSDLTRLRAGTWGITLEVQTSGRLHMHYALK